LQVDAVMKAILLRRLEFASMPIVSVAIIGGRKFVSASQIKGGGLDRLSIRGDLMTSCRRMGFATD
jgi:hypothetical protein